MKKIWIVILLAFLLGVSAVSVVKYFLLQKENSYLNANLKQIKVQIDAFEAERLNLLRSIEKHKEESSTLQDNLEVSEDKLVKVETDLAQAQKTIEELNSQFSNIKAENAALKESSDNLKVKLLQVTQEKEGIEAKLKSISELKKLIKELKSQATNTKIKLHAIKTKSRVLIEGNRGFIIKDGKPNSPAEVKIEVNPAP